MLTSPPVPYDLCNGIPISHLLTVIRRLFSIVSEKCLKCESASGHFQPGEGQSRGLFRDYENFSDGLFAALHHSYTACSCTEHLSWNNFLIFSLSRTSSACPSSRTKTWTRCWRRSLDSTPTSLTSTPHSMSCTRKYRSLQHYHFGMTHFKLPFCEPWKLFVKRNIICYYTFPDLYSLFTKHWTWKNY